MRSVGPQTRYLRQLATSVFHPSWPTAWPLIFPSVQFALCELPPPVLLGVKSSHSLVSDNLVHDSSFFILARRVLPADNNYSRLPAAFVLHPANHSVYSSVHLLRDFTGAVRFFSANACPFPNDRNTVCRHFEKNTAVNFLRGMSQLWLNTVTVRIFFFQFV